MNPELTKKYLPYPPVDLPDRTWPNMKIDKAPSWCSVDLRDGNQALIQPMSMAKKLEMFDLLVELGFKEIETGFPSASQVEYAFTRKLIDDALIPDDVSIQVLTQARAHLIKRTFESIKGAPAVIVHLYNSTSVLQRDVVFQMNKQEIIDLAVNGAEMILREAANYPQTRFQFQYSPESFTGTELDYALEVCEAVIEVWKPTPEQKVIINLPATVEMATPNIYADQIEWFCRNMKKREAAIISVHTHNDRGCAVAATELALMAGADRVEGTLFGNGERTGNVDIITLALNMFTQGVDPRLDFHNIAHVIDVYERVNSIPVHLRHPYAGELVYTAFSGSHQDAINKGMSEYQANGARYWSVPYLPIDPTDVGRSFESIIRINSQSGKGGVAYVLDHEYGIKMPKEMHPEFGTLIQKITDRDERELKAEEIYQAFNETYLDSHHPYDLHSFHVSKRHSDKQEKKSFAQIVAVVGVDGVDQEISASGNGPLDAFSTALKERLTGDFKLLNYHEHAINTGSSARAIAYIQVRLAAGKVFWGAGVDTDIIIASVKALLSSLNRSVLKA